MVADAGVLDTAAGLAPLAQALATAPWVALDTEANLDVSTRWTTPGAERLTAMGASLGHIPGSQVPKTCTGIVAFLLGLGSAEPTRVAAPTQGADSAEPRAAGPATDTIETDICVIGAGSGGAPPSS